MGKTPTLAEGDSGDICHGLALPVTVLIFLAEMESKLEQAERWRGDPRSGALSEEVQIWKVDQK